MKLTMTRVLTPLAALAITLGVQAKDYAKDDFEGSWSNSTGGYSFTAGPDLAADATEQYTYQAGEAPAAAISPIGGATNLKGLKLSTEDGILFRNLTGANIGDGGLYVDTDVQFTLTDKSDRPTVQPTIPGSEGDKFIIWLEADEDNRATNLCVWAREYAMDNGELDFASGSNKVYVLDSASDITPGSWHRLTVKAIKKSYKDDQGLNVPGFQVYLDNTLLTSSQTIVPDDDYQAAYAATAGTPLQSLIDGQLKFFPAMSDSLGTLAKVGFSGEGKIDDFVVSDNIPSSLPRVAVNVTFPAAVGCATLMGVDFTNSPAFLTLEPGQSFTFSMADLKNSHLQPLEGYSFKLDEGALSDDWAIDGNIDGSYDDNDEAVTITAGLASATIASFTIALEQSNNAKLTLDLSGIEDYLDKIDTLSCTVGGVTTTIANANLDDQVFFDGLQLNDVVTLSATLQSGVSGVAVFTVDSGATGSGSTFTITDNSAWINVTLATPVAMVGDLICTTFADALAAAKSTGDAIQLCGDLELEEAATIAANEEVTIDLNGYTITGADDAAAFANAGTLTITDLSQDHDGGVAAGSNGYVVANTGTLNLVYGGYAGEFTNSGTFNITTDCEFDNNLAGAYEADDGYVVTETYTGSGVWKLALVTYTITYMNGESPVSGLSPATYTVEDNVTLPTDLGEIVGVTLDGWKDGDGNDVAGWTAGDYHTNLTFYAQTSVVVPPTPWYDNPQAVVLAEDLPTQNASKGPSAFHGQGQGGYLGLTFGTNPLRFDLYGVDGTNALTTIHSVAKADLPQVPGLRGVAISETLGVAMALSYYGTNTMYTFPLTPLVGGNGQKAVTKPTTHAFDAAAFSPDGNYLFSNALEGESSNQFYVKWSVSVDDNTGALALSKVGSIDAGGRARNLAYARINGRDIVFGLADSGKVVAIDMTGDDASAWTAADLVTGLPAVSYGSLCVSGVAAGALKLTVATSVNNDNSGDVLNVYDVEVPASGAVTASLIKSFDQAAMAAAGFGTLGTAFYGNTVYVTDDNKTIYFARADRKLYAAEYVEPAPSGETINPGEQSTTTYESQAAAEAAIANVTIAASDAVTNVLDSAAQAEYLAKFEAKAVEVGETGTYKIEVALTAAAATELGDEATTNVALAVAAQLPTIAAAAVGSQTDIAVTGVVPGFYYSISYGTAVNAINTEGARVLAPASGSITLQTPAKASGATTGFYRVNVNVADVPPPPPNEP